MVSHPQLDLLDHPLARVLLTQLRDLNTHAPSFRALIDEITSLTLFRAMRNLELESTPVATPLCETEGWQLARTVAFAPVLRAGLGMVPAAQRLVPDAEVWHLGLYRDEKTLDPVSYYNKIEPGSLDAHEVFVLDPMLATAGTAIAVLDVLKAAGCGRLHLVAIIGAPEGVARLADRHPDVPVCLASLDERLTSSSDPWPKGYILPGLGDAGDRQFGT